jgi:hypothetical protein
MLVGHLPREQPFRDHADRVRSAGSRCPGNRTHARDAATTRDECVTASSELRADVGSKVDVALRDPLTRGAEHADGRHQPSTGGPPTWLEGGTTRGASPWS